MNAQQLKSEGQQQVLDANATWAELAEAFTRAFIDMHGIALQVKADD
jgi:hypothetical protein